MLCAQAGGSEMGGTTAQVPSLIPHLHPTPLFPLCELEGEEHERSETPVSWEGSQNQGPTDLYFLPTEGQALPRKGHP